MKKILILIGLFLCGLTAVELPVDNETQNKQITQDKQLPIFGQNLFNGSFSKSSHHRFNPDYILNIGDTINLKLWGAIDLELKITVDEQGNIFIPKVGTVKLLGIKNKNLTETIQKKLKTTYKNNVYSYSNLDNFQPVTVFVTGAVSKPGLYEGLSSDSILQFIDKAKGIANNGSYRNINILRNNTKLKSIDLYDYLLEGNLDIFQFRTGDIVKIDYKKDFITIDGDVLQPYEIEIKDNTILDDIIKLVQPKPEANNVMLTNYDNENKKSIKMF